MFNFLRDFDFDGASFAIGVIVGSIIWWLLNTLRPYFQQAGRALRVQMSDAREGMTLGTEIRWANDLLRQVQGLHLAAPLFSLDEIRIEPRILAPPPPARPGEDVPDIDIVGETIPYLPDWPEFAGRFGAKTLSLPQAMSGGANLILMGNNGAGKTFALADLASRVARGDTGTGDLAELVPIYIHAFDFDPEFDEQRTPIIAIMEATSKHASPLTNRQLPRLIQSVFSMGRALLLLDGVDELPAENVDEYANYLETLLMEYPDIRVIVTASMEYIGRLRGLGLHPVTMASWGKSEEQAFVSNWSTLWKRYVNPEIWSFDYDIPHDQDVMGLPPAPTQIDPMMINSWLNDQSTQTPLEFTLKVWSAYAGDMLGHRPLAGIKSYLRRMSTTVPTGRAAMEKLAKTMTINGQSLIHRSQVDATGVLSEVSDSADEDEFDDDELDVELDDPTSESKVSVRRALSRLVNLGLLRGWDGARVSFTNPVFQGYLSGAALNQASEVEKIYTQPDWVGRTLALKYMAAFGEVSPLAVKIMETSEDPLQDGLITLGSWLSNSNKADNWRALTMRKLAKLIQNDVYSAGLRYRALAGLATSGDQDVATLFRHLLTSDSAEVRQMGALGAGYLMDVEAVPELSVKLYDPTPSVRRAACLALVNIGTDEALEQTASALLHGDEDLRRAAAEAFANHPNEGHPILKDGATLDDLLVRRAVVFGLLRIREDWALQLLQEIQMGDEQWVVRNAATQALEEMDNLDAAVPVPQPPLHELPWLIAYAGEKGKGVTSGKPAQDMLRQALKDGSEEERQAAMEQIYRDPDTGMIIDMMHILYGTGPELRRLLSTRSGIWILKVSIFPRRRNLGSVPDSP